MNNSARGTSSYSYTVSPRAVQANRPKYRDPASQQQPPQNEGLAGTNIMFDKRVVRGSTIAHAQTKTFQPAPPPQEKDRLRRPRPSKSPALSPSTPDPVYGRKHMDIQTDEYLEELSDRPIEIDADTQTDPLLDRPSSPKFIPKKSGVDADTQIYPGELFDFDYEVEPILEVLVGKILEQSMMEIMEEDELANLQLHQREFEQKRNAELAEVQRMEETERRKLEEKERRLAQERERVLAEKKTKEKVSARQFAQQFLSNLTADVFTNLTNQGYFYDTTVREVETQFLPWVFTQMGAELQRAEVSHQIINHLIQTALEKSEHIHRVRKQKDEEEEEERKKASHEVKFNMEVVYHDDESKMSAVNHDEDEEAEDDDADDDDDDDEDEEEEKSSKGRLSAKGPHR